MHFTHHTHIHIHEYTPTTPSHTYPHREYKAASIASSKKSLQSLYEIAFNVNLKQKLNHYR